MRYDKFDGYLKCECCSKKDLRDFQMSFNKSRKEALSKAVKEGRSVSVKKAFGNNPFVEHMWVAVDEVDLQAGTLSGTLDNTPLFDQGILFGDRVAFKMTEISDLNFQ